MRIIDYKKHTIAIEVIEAGDTYGYFLTAYSGSRNPQGQPLASLTQLFTINSKDVYFETEGDAVTAAATLARSRIDEHLN